MLKSQQFIRWFGDWQNSPETASKIVNFDGTPKVMYHGTQSRFSAFDKKKATADVIENISAVFCFSNIICFGVAKQIIIVDKRSYLRYINIEDRARDCRDRKSVV